MSKYGKLKCDNVDYISLEEVFPNPTKLQIDLWNEHFGDGYSPETMCSDNYLKECIWVIHRMMTDEIEHRKNEVN
ncbi:MAG: hypothetical protein H8E71_00335 [Candidatus Marinimicrobia bacterium]|nr:hypothetical protein [Candidatus Neomarinimicrobiota bacterium]